MKVLLSVLFFGACSVAALGQRPAPPTILNQPYVATGVETKMVKGENGLMVEHLTPLLAARDSGGRTWVKRRMVDLRHPEAVTDKYEVTMFDPWGSTLSTWCTCDGVMRVTYLRPAAGAAAVTKKGKGKSAPAVHAVVAEDLAREDVAGQHLESLPGETILGEPTRGYKMVVGDGSQTTTVRTWYSGALALDLKTIEENSKTGERRSEFKEVKKVEPEDGMFASAAEYTARD